VVDRSSPFKMIGLSVTLAIMMSASTRFSVVEVGGRCWFRAPSGILFHSYGICCVNTGLAPSDLDPLNPAYSASKYYKSDQDWGESAKGRMAQWGFNTVGAWSDHNLLKSPSLYQTPVLHLSAMGVPWVDPWDNNVIDSVNKYARDIIEKHAKDPNVIGYFSDNELGWWMGALFDLSFKYKPNSEGRTRLVNALKSKYKTWDCLQEDFYSENASSFTDLLASGRLYLRPNGNGVEFVRYWLKLVAKQYYRIAKNAILMADPKALYLGDRYISNYYPEVAKAAGDFVDVVSTNLNADWSNGKITPFYLPCLHNLTQKPVLITEFYAAAMENSSGNSNDSSGFPTVKTQKDRVKSFSNQLNAIRQHPFVVGAHWFQYYDEGMHGREDGENYNMGLVDIYDKPYTLLVKECSRLLRHANKLAFKPPRNPLPLPLIHPFDAKDLSQWETDVACMPLETPNEARGDCFLSWNAGGLYAAFHWYEDRFLEALYQEGKVPVSEMPKATLRVNGLDIVVHADGCDKAVASRGVVLAYKGADGSNGDTRNTLILRIPAKDLGFVKLIAGQPFKVSGALSTRAKAYNMRWSSEVTLAP